MRKWESFPWLPLLLFFLLPPLPPEISASPSVPPSLHTSPSPPYSCVTLRSSSQPSPRFPFSLLSFSRKRSFFHGANTSINGQWPVRRKEINKRLFPFLSSSNHHSFPFNIPFYSSLSPPIRNSLPSLLHNYRNPLVIENWEKERGKVIDSWAICSEKIVAIRRNEKSVKWRNDWLFCR